MRAAIPVEHRLSHGHVSGYLARRHPADRDANGASGGVGRQEGSHGLLGGFDRVSGGWSHRVQRLGVYSDSYRLPTPFRHTPRNL